MRILIIPDSFKENLSATAVSKAIRKGVFSVIPRAEIREIPFSDGGEGALDVLLQHAKGSIAKCKTENVLGEKIEAQYFRFEEKKTAWIELSQASGLAQIPVEHRNALKASTYGTGLLVKDALSKGCKKIILGVGGSATTDGGAGIFQALGGKLLDPQGREIGQGGAALSELETLISPSISDQVQWSIACDVENPLLGSKGAAAIYGPQKGASPEAIKRLDKNLEKLAKIIAKNYNRSIVDLKGGGAAGGTAAGMHGFFNASLASGFSLFSEMINLEEKVQKADLIFTAEGKIDEQSIQGKLTGSVAQLAKKYQIPVIGLAGSIKGPYTPLYAAGFSGVFAIQNGPMSLIESKENAAELLADTASRVLSLYIQKTP